MKSRILMLLVSLVFIGCVGCGAEEIAEDIFTSEEVIEPSYHTYTEEEKKQIYDEYLENVFAKDITEIKGVLDCKVDMNIDNEDDSENSVTIQYFYDPNEIDDFDDFEESIKKYMQANLPSADVIYTRGTPVTHEVDTEDVLEDNSIIQNLPADLDTEWNYEALDAD